MCICINCRHINKCTTYTEIKKRHNVNNKNIVIEDIFLPYHNTIQVNIQFKQKERYIYLDWDLTECLSFVEQPGSWTIN
uniref:Ycf34 n=1 Tax=Anotrichium furcellatum TaxID=41999 RepID=A0A4D6WRZ4_9FLOR|nr:hypothetical protein [Anotrichium furcellatum]